MVTKVSTYVIDLQDELILNANPVQALGAATKQYVDLAVSASGIIASVNGQTGIVVLDSDDVSEGATNLYYTESRVNSNASVAANATDRHSHANSGILDAMTASYTTGEESKLDAIESSATADQTKSEIDTLILKGSANGYATLDAGSKIPQSQIPNLAITDTFVVANQAAMLALSSAQTGDVAIRTDENKTYILKGTTYSTLGDWSELLTPTDAVSSVGGNTGAVSAAQLLTSIKTVDGGGSGLDADTLDGLEATSFLGISSTAADSTKWSGGTKTISAAAPSGGVDGDVWFQV